jgi:hypothetical protein
MKNLIIVLISLFTFSTYSSFAISTAESTNLKISSVDILENDVLKSPETLQIKISTTQKTIEENQLFGWICFAKLVDRKVERGVDGNLYVTETYEVRCYYFDFSAYELQPY